MTTTPSDRPRHAAHAGHARGSSTPYVMFAVNMILGLAIMYVAMFTMVDGIGDVRGNLNTLYMALTMAAPMGILMLATMRGMYWNRTLNLILYVLLAAITVGSFMATRSQALIGDRQFIASMIPHHSGAILMCRKARLADPALAALCQGIAQGQRTEIDQMEMIRRRLANEPY